MTDGIGAGEAVRVLVDRHACETHGLCAELAPEIFAISDDDEMVLLQERPEASSIPMLRDAVAACPRVALDLEIRSADPAGRTEGDT